MGMTHIYIEEEQGGGEGHELVKLPPPLPLCLYHTCVKPNCCWMDDVSMRYDSTELHYYNFGRNNLNPIVTEIDIIDRIT